MKNRIPKAPKGFKTKAGFALKSDAKLRAETWRTRGFNARIGKKTKSFGYPVFLKKKR